MANKSPVDVYFNLHKDLFSIKSRKTGKVIMHSEKVYLGLPSFIVQPSGYRRVIKEKKKNVHAFVRSDNWTVVDTPKWVPEFEWEKIRYNPYEGPYFQDELGGKVDSAVQAKLVLIDGKPKIFGIGLQHDVQWK